MDSIDFEYCLICQKDSSEKLRCSANETFHRKDVGSGYATLISNFIEFKKLGKEVGLTKLLHLENLDQILLLNKGKWHKSCSLKYNKTKLTRLACSEDALKLEKRQIGGVDSVNKRKSVRLTSDTISTFSKVCIFCNDDSKKLCQVSTFEVDYRIRKIATKISDTNLLSKLSEGDLIAREGWYHPTCLVSIIIKTVPL